MGDSACSQSSFTVPREMLRRRRRALEREEGGSDWADTVSRDGGEYKRAFCVGGSSLPLFTCTLLCDPCTPGAPCGFLLALTWQSCHNEDIIKPSLQLPYEWTPLKRKCLQVFSYNIQNILHWPWHRDFAVEMSKRRRRRRRRRYVIDIHTAHSVQHTSKMLVEINRDLVFLKILDFI